MLFGSTERETKLLQSQKFIAVFFIFFCAGLAGYVSGIWVFLWYIIASALYTFVAYALHILYKKIRRTLPQHPIDFSWNFLRRMNISTALIILIIGGFAVYHNHIIPAKIPLYTLSNGEQVIKFQTMSHIGSRSFYRQVVHNIFSAKKDDYVLYYEGVGPGSEENIQAFDQALGVKLTPSTYDNLSKLYGTSSQNNDEFLGIINNKDYNIDLNLDEVMELYKEKKGWPKNAQTSYSGSEYHDIEQELVRRINTLNNRELAVMRYFNQSIINMIVKNEALRNSIMSQLNSDIFEVILDERNKYLVGEILSRKDQKIFITYGLMHFQGVLSLLQSHDPKWQIIDTTQHVLLPQHEQHAP